MLSYRSSALGNGAHMDMQESPVSVNIVIPYAKNVDLTAFS